MVRRRTITSDARTRVPGGSRTGRVSRTPRAMPDDTEMSARASRLRAGRQSAGAGGRQGLAGSAMYSIQDMLNHPAVGFSRGMARGPAQGKVDAITNDVHKSLAEQGIFQGEDGTWQIDMAQNAAYREAKRGSSSVPGIPQAGGGLPGGILPRQTSTPNLPYPGPGKPSTPTGGTGTRMPGPPVGGGMPAPRTPSTTQAGPPVGPAPTTGGTLPRQGPIYTPKPAEPSDGTLPRQLPPGTLPRQTTPIGYDAQGNPLPKVAGPNPGGGGTLPRQSGPAQVPPGTQQAIDVFRQGQQPQSKPPGGIPGQPQQPPRPGMPSPTGRPQAPTWPTMPNGQQMGQGNTSDLGGQIQARVAQMIGQRQQGVGQGNPAMQGLAGLGERIQQTVQGRVSGVGRGATMPGTVNSRPPGEGRDLSQLGSQIQQTVQGRLQANRPGTPIMSGGANWPQIPNGPMGPAPGNPGGGAGTPPGPGTIPQPPGGPAPGNPNPAPPTGPGTGQGSLGSYGNASIDQWDSAFIAAGNATGVDPRILKAMAEIESGGNGNIPLDQCRDDGYGDGGSCGLMQIKPNIWGASATTEDQIMKAAQILADYKNAHPGATDKDALFAVYFPADDPNGTTQGSYGAKVDQLVSQMGNYDPNVSQLPNTGTGPGTLPRQPGGDIPTEVGPITPTTQPGQGLNTIMGIAEAGLGIPYGWSGGITMDSVPLDQVSSWDCSEFTRYATHAAGYGNVPMGSEAQYQVAADQGILKQDLAGLKPGDLVFYDTGWRGGGYCGGWGDCGGCLNCASHVGIYMGNGEIIQAGTDGTTRESVYFGDYPILGYASPSEYQYQNTYGL